MGKPNHSYEKRRRELEKKKKKETKRQRKLEKKNAAAAEDQEQELNQEQEQDQDQNSWSRLSLAWDRCVIFHRGREGVEEAGSTNACSQTAGLDGEFQGLRVLLMMAAMDPTGTAYLVIEVRKE